MDWLMTPLHGPGGFAVGLGGVLVVCVAVWLLGFWVDYFSFDPNDIPDVRALRAGEIVAANYRFLRPAALRGIATLQRTLDTIANPTAARPVPVVADPAVARLVPRVERIERDVQTILDRLPEPARWAPPAAPVAPPEPVTIEASQPVARPAVVAPTLEPDPLGTPITKQELLAWLGLKPTSDAALRNSDAADRLVKCTCSVKGQTCFTFESVRRFVSDDGYGAGRFDFLPLEEAPDGPWPERRLGGVRVVLTSDIRSGATAKASRKRVPA